MCDRRILSLRPARLGRAHLRGRRRGEVQPPPVRADHRRLRGEVRPPRRPGRARRPRLPAPARAAAHARDRPGDDRPIAVAPVRALRPRQRERQGPRRGDRAGREPDPDDPHEPALQRLDPPPPAAADETRASPAPWRANPPVSDELWARVEEVRRAKTRGGGPKRRDRVDLLGGLLECVCGRRIRNDGTFGDGRHRKLHVKPCEAWGRKARIADDIWEGPMLAQVAGITVDDDTIASVVAVLGSTSEAGRDRPGPDRPADPRARPRARRRRAGRRRVPRPAQGAPRGAGRDRRAAPRPASARSGRSSGCVPSPSQSSGQTYRRRRQS